MFNITKEDIVKYVEAGCKFVGDTAIASIGASLDRVSEEAFAKAVEIGIRNTIAALYDANVDDEDILRVVYEHWGIGKDEAMDRLVFEKYQATMRSLRQYLKLQGFTEERIQSFFIESRAPSRIRHNSDLWKLRKHPQKLFEAVRK